MVSAEKIKLLRNQHGWSQEQLANISGVSARTIQRIEKSGDCSLESKMALAGAFNLTVSQLCDDETTVASNTDHSGWLNLALWGLFVTVILAYWLNTGASLQLLLHQGLLLIGVFWFILSARVQGLAAVATTFKLAIGLKLSVSLHQTIAHTHQQITFTYTAAMFTWALVALQMLHLEQPVEIWAMQIAINLLIAFLYASFWAELVLRPVKARLNGQLMQQHCE